MLDGVVADAADRAAQALREVQFGASPTASPLVIRANDSPSTAQGPRGLTGAAAEAEERAARQRLVGDAEEDPSRSGATTIRRSSTGGWRGLLDGARARLFTSEAASPSSSASEYALELGEPSGDDCPICLAPLTSCVATPCGHSFHAACLEHYFITAASHEPGRRRKCPLCRSSVHAPMPVEATALSGRAIDVTAVPAPGGRCHYDRHYHFINLGGFDKIGMLYVMTSNEDRRTSSQRAMWVLQISVPVTVHLNFRSDDHVAAAGGWLEERGWARNESMRSAKSSGIPNGPYTGPTFSRRCEPGRLELNGSNTWEGVYFVFVELLAPPPAA